MKLRVDDLGVTIALADGSTIEVCDRGRPIEGLAGELADGQTFTGDDGWAMTRRGEEEVWFTPKQQRHES
jgi:hypothetical protein